MPRAPKHCGFRGCTTIVPSGRCHEHTGWKTSPPTASAKVTGTRKWKALRQRILARDNHMCQIRYEGICTGLATEVDKIIPANKRPDLAMVETNLRASCSACNDHKNRKYDRR